MTQINACRPLEKGKSVKMQKTDEAGISQKAGKPKKFENLAFFLNPSCWFFFYPTLLLGRSTVASSRGAIIFTPFLSLRLYLQYYIAYLSFFFCANFKHAFKSTVFNVLCDKIWVLTHIVCQRMRAAWIGARENDWWKFT